MFEIIFLIFFGNDNRLRAKLKGENGIKWAAITAGVFLVSEFFGAFFVLVFFLKDKINFNLVASNPQYKDQAVLILNQEFKDNPLLLVTIYGFGVGGYLLVRYLLDKKGDKNKDNVHWMDKLNNNSPNV